MRLKFLILVFFLAGFRSATIQGEAEEYYLKAAFIYNFTKFIEWNVPLSNGEFCIGVVGTSPILAPLTNIARSKTVKDKKIIIRQFNNPAEINTCNLLFVSQSTPYDISEIIGKLPRGGTLIVTEKEGYATKGAALNFVIVDNKLKFEANIKALNSEGLTASSQLLKLAIIIEE